MRSTRMTDVSLLGDLEQPAKSPYSWKRAAKFLNIEVADVQKLVSVGQLKLVDTFVTDRAFEEF